MLESTPTLPRKLQIGVVASIILVAFGILNAFTDVLSTFFPLLAIALPLLSLCGTFCGITAAVTLRGFQRLVAVLAALVCLKALIHCVGILSFLLW